MLPQATWRMDIWRRRRRGPAGISGPSYVGDMLDEGALGGLGGGGATSAEMKLGGKAGDTQAEGYFFFFFPNLYSARM